MTVSHSGDDGDVAVPPPGDDVAVTVPPPHDDVAVTVAVGRGRPDAHDGQGWSCC